MPEFFTLFFIFVGLMFSDLEKVTRGIKVFKASVPLSSTFVKMTCNLPWLV